MKPSVQRPTYSFTYNRKKLTQMSISWRTAHLTIVYPYDRVLLIRKKDTAICNHIDQYKKFANWKKKAWSAILDDFFIEQWPEKGSVTGAECRSVFASSCRKLIAKGHRVTFRVLEMFYILINGGGSMTEYISQTLWSLHFKWLNTTACKLCLRKPDLGKNPTGYILLEE